MTSNSPAPETGRRGSPMRGGLVGAGAAACAVCCAAPLAALVGIGLTGAAATAFALAFAGVVFAAVVVVATVGAVVLRRRQGDRNACAPSAGPVPVELGSRPDGS